MYSKILCYNIRVRRKGGLIMLDIILMFVAVALIILSLMQSGKNDGLSGAFTGAEGLNLFSNVKERGPEKVISNLTMVVGVAFFIIVIIMSIK